MAPAKKRQGCSWPLTVCRNSMVSWEPSVLASASETPGTMRDRLSVTRSRTSAENCCSTLAALLPSRRSRSPGSGFCIAPISRGFRL